MAGDLKLKYGTDVAFTMTGLDAVDSSSTFVGGWTSDYVNNTSTLAKDFTVQGTFTTEATNRQAGYIYVYIYATLDDTPTSPDLFSSGTEGSVGAATVHDTYRRNSGMRLVVPIEVDNTASAIYTFPPTGIKQFFGGVVPPYWAVWVTSNACTSTNDWCASGQIYYSPVLDQYT